MNSSSAFHVVLYSSCLAAALPLLGPTQASGELIGPGDPIVVIHETAVKVSTETRAVLQPGAEFTANKVNGSWLSVSGTRNGESYSGWIHSRDVAKCRQGLSLSWAVKKHATSNQYWYWPLPQGISQVIELKSSVSVDLFILSEEGLASYKWAVDHSSGQMSAKLGKRNVTTVHERWQPPDGQKYYLVVDNTNFPDGGARGSYASNFELVVWRDDPRPEEPIVGRGLIIGQVTLVFDGYRGRNHRFSQPMTVHVACNDEGDSDDDFEIIKAVTDGDGYFTLANLPLDRRYWVKAVEGPDFEAPVTIRVSRAISSPDDEPSSRQVVLDVGYIALTVASDGKIGVQMESPSFVVKSAAGEDSSQVQFSANVDLERHAWFLRTFPFSGWATIVRQDQSRIEHERDEEKDA